MCGIAGVYSLKGERISAGYLKRMADVLRHRGPDDEGYVLLDTSSMESQVFSGKDSVREVKDAHPRIDECSASSYDLGFSHRRLSIIDLSVKGHQPMSNEDGDIWIVYNGEIYNYLELASELRERGHLFRTKSDTEVIIHAYEEWGAGCLQKFNGMWVFAIWDQKDKKMFCSRDRFGIKPFYYTYNEETFVFSSEIKALLEDDTERRANDEMIRDYLAFGLQDHTDQTFFLGINQIRPAHYLLIQDGVFKVEKYWDVGVNGETSRVKTDISEFRGLFEDAVRLRLRSDVPVGTCLSGGLDSSSIVCTMNSLISGETGQMTFSSCFDDKKFDERDYIQMVIEETGAEDNYIFPKAEEFQKEIEDLVYYQDEPFGSLSIYAQWCVMKRASEDVKVLLDGQGGDELLAGYLEYYASFIKTLVSKREYILSLKEILCFTLLHTRLIYELFSKMRMRERRKGLLSQEFSSGCGSDGYSYVEDISSKLLKDLTREKLPSLLKYEDRNSMAFSVESRLPFLDYRLVEYATSLPIDQKLSRGTTKVILRRAMRGIIPDKVRRRRDKMGFVTPEEVWMKTELRGWAEEVLNSASFKGRKYWDAEKVIEEFGEICAGRMKYTSDIWRYISLELWLRRFIDG